MKDEEAEAETFSLSLTELEEQGRQLTLDEVALLFNNHSRALTILEGVLEEQSKQVVTLMYTLAAYLKQYPLDIEKLYAGDLSPVVPDHVEPAHFKHPGAYL